MSEQNVMRGDPNRIYRPGYSAGGGFTSGLADGVQGIANMLQRRKAAKRLAEYQMEREKYKEEQTDKRSAQREAATAEKAKELENLRHQHRMEQLKFQMANKKTKHKIRTAKEHERIQMETGRFAPGMRSKTLSDGKTPNPYHKFSPEQEAMHIANLAKETGWEPDHTVDMPENTEGAGWFGMGGEKIPAGSFTIYKPGENANIESTPQMESQPTESE